jgi:hypothetical protein
MKLVVVLLATAMVGFLVYHFVPAVGSSGPMVGVHMIPWAALILLGAGLITWKVVHSR